MTILHLVTRRQYRGAEVFASELCTLLANEGHTVIFAGLYPPPAEQVLEVPGVVNTDLNGKKSSLNFSLIRKLAALIRQYQPDIIQANGSDTLKYAVLAKKLYFPHVPVVYRNISMVSSWASTGGMKNLFNRLLFKQVDFVTSVGRQSLEDLVKTYQYPVQLTQVINRGIPDQSFDRAMARKKICDEFGWTITDPIVIHIGQFSDEKNHPFLVDSFSKVIDSCADARLMMIGVGKNFNAIGELVRQKRLDKHIVLAGHRSPVQEYLAGADLFILGSTIEGVPGVVLEAAMQSVPSVAVRVGGVGEVVKDGETGVLLPSHDAGTFSAAVIRLLTDKDTRNKLGSEARRFVLEQYSLQACLRQFENLYARVLSKVPAKK